MVIPAGSLRRGRDTVGDIDLLATGPACEEDVVGAAVEYTAAYPPIADMLAKGQNKVSFRLRSGLQVDVRLLPRASYGAALQYFTGSKMHNVAVRQRALKQGYTLSEYALATARRRLGGGRGYGGGYLRGAGHGLDSAGAAREQRRVGGSGCASPTPADRAGGHSRRCAHAHRRHRWPATRFERWPMRRRHGATSTSPSQITRRTWR